MRITIKAALILDPLTGSDISDACAEAVQLKRMARDTRTFLDFNGKVIEVEITSTVESLVHVYRSAK